MFALLIVVAVVIAATAYGLWDKKRTGKIAETQMKNPRNILTASDLGSQLGELATLVQFSSSFCAPCKTTRGILSSAIAQFPKIKHIEIDAESHLDLVRRLHINQTPTTIFLNSRGEEFARAVGAPRKDQVITALQRI